LSYLCRKLYNENHCSSYSSNACFRHTSYLGSRSCKSKQQPSYHSYTRFFSVVKVKAKNPYGRPHKD
jgi:hypothetical protein